MDQAFLEELLCLCGACFVIVAHHIAAETRCAAKMAIGDQLRAQQDNQGGTEHGVAQNTVLAIDTVLGMMLKVNIACK